MVVPAGALTLRRMSASRRQERSFPNCIGQGSSSPIFGLPNEFALFGNISPPLLPKRAQLGCSRWSSLVFL